MSEGCRNCYAERVAARFNGPGMPYEGLAKRAANGEARWTGRVEFVEKHLSDPLRWQKPRRIFVNSMSDLFHESLPDEAIDRVFAVMALAPWHTFQVLTKRPERMRAYLEREPQDAICAAAAPLMHFDEMPACDWPLPNVWLGVSVEDQATADERIPLLLDTPAAKRFVSYEPALAPVNFAPWLDADTAPTDFGGASEQLAAPALDWIIVGGESGPGARPFNIQWARTTVRQCKAAGVACFVKQIGAVPVLNMSAAAIYCAKEHRSLGWRQLKSGKGDDPSEWPEDLRVQEFPA